MVQLLEFVWKHRHEPLGWLVLGSLLVIADRLGRKFVTHQLKRLFGVEDRNEFKELIHNTKAILENQRTIMNHMGVSSWNAESAATSDCMTRKSSLFYSLMKYLAPHVVSFIASLGTAKSILLRRVENMKINKVWLITLLGYVALIVKHVWGVDVPNQWVEMAADSLVYVLPIILAWVNRKKSNYGDHGEAV